MRSPAPIARWLFSAAVFAIVACGGGVMNPPPSPGSNDPIKDICNCTPSAPVSSDFRHNAKHVGLPGATGQNITVAEVLAWDQNGTPGFDAPRSGRELQEFFIPHAWLQLARVNPGDCDIHLEISDVADKGARRMIVETTIDSEFCTARKDIQQQLAANGFTLNNNSGELLAALPVQVLGLAFQDVPHQRGSQFVATVWEIHPAVVTILPQ